MTEPTGEGADRRAGRDRRRLDRRDDARRRTRRSACRRSGTASSPPSRRCGGSGGTRGRGRRAFGSSSRGCGRTARTSRCCRGSPQEQGATEHRRAVRLPDAGRGRDGRAPLGRGHGGAQRRARVRARATRCERGLKIASYPGVRAARAGRPDAGRSASAGGSGAGRRASTVREYLRYAWYQGLFGCAYPDRNYVVRPNGAVNPCIYWEGDPIGFYPADTIETHREGRSPEGDPRRPAQREAGRHLRDVRRAAHGALSSARRAAAGDRARPARLPTHPR